MDGGVSIPDTTPFLRGVDIARFHQCGYLVLENFLSRCQLDSLICECDAITRACSASSAKEDASRCSYESYRTTGCIFEPLSEYVRSCVHLSKAQSVEKGTSKSTVEDHFLWRTDLVAFTHKRKSLSCALHTSFMTCDVLLGQPFKDVAVAIGGMMLSHSINLFNEQYIVKPRDFGTFALHADSEYMSHPRSSPYISVWLPLDNVDEENGTLYVLPYPGGRESTIPSRFATPGDYSLHHQLLHRNYLPLEKYNIELHETGAITGEVPIEIPAGSAVVLSHLVLHRSNANLSMNPRRVFMPQYSFGSIGTVEKGGLAIPLA